MKKKIEINPEELQDWLQNTWHLYASQGFNGELLRLWINSLNQYRVVYGDEILYEGSQMTHALSAWERS